MCKSKHVDTLQGISIANINGNKRNSRKEKDERSNFSLCYFLALASLGNALLHGRYSFTFQVVGSVSGLNHTYSKS